MNRNDTIDVLTMVAALDRRTVGETDITAWGTVLGDIDPREAAEAIIAHFRECPGIWLEPGHIVERVRAARRDQLAREGDAVREARQEGQAAKALEDAEALAARKGLPPPERVNYTRASAIHGINPLAVPCPWCKAHIGARCVTPGTGVMLMPDGNLRTGFHPIREESARNAAGKASQWPKM